MSGSGSVIRRVVGIGLCLLGLPALGIGAWLMFIPDLLTKVIAFVLMLGGAGLVGGGIVALTIKR